MKINPLNMRVVNPYQNAQRAQKAASASESFADKLEISSAAKEMQISSTQSSERAEKINKLKSEIQSGEYKVDARQVAEDMLKYYRF